MASNESVERGYLKANLVELATNVMKFAVPALILFAIGFFSNKELLGDHLTHSVVGYLIIFSIMHFVSIQIEKSAPMKHWRDPLSNTKKMITGCWCEFYHAAGKDCFSIFFINDIEASMTLRGHAYDAESNQAVGAWEMSYGSVSASNKIAMMMYRYTGLGVNRSRNVGNGFGLGNIEFDFIREYKYTKIVGFFADEQNHVRFSGVRVPDKYVVQVEENLENESELYKIVSDMINESVIAKLSSQLEWRNHKKLA